MKKAVFGIIVTTRGFFNPELARRGRLRLLKKLHDKGHETVSLEPNGSETGLVETYADSIRCAELFRREKDRIDGIIISIPNFGDETSTVEAMRLAELDVPVLVHAFDDRTDLLDLENRRDSFCGKISICANLKQYGIRFTNTTLHSVFWALPVSTQWHIHSECLSSNTNKKACSNFTFCREQKRAAFPKSPQKSGSKCLG